MSDLTEAQVARLTALTLGYERARVARSRAEREFLEGLREKAL